MTVSHRQFDRGNEWLLFDTEENGSPNGITFHGVLSSPQSNDMPCVAYQDPLG